MKNARNPLAFFHGKGTKQMKKNRYLLSTILFGMLLMGCAGGNTSSPNSTNSGDVPSVNPPVSSGTPSVEPSVNVPSSTPSPSTPTPSPSTGGGTSTGAIPYTKAVELLVGSEEQDVKRAKTSETSLLVRGYDGGRRYEQKQEFTSTSYQNNLTIESGTVEQFFFDTPDTKYSDTYDEVRTIEDSNYIRTRCYQNHVFTDETERLNLLMADPNQMVQVLAYYQSLVSCGAGSTAYDQFYESYLLQPSLSYASRFVDEGLWFYFHAEAQSNEDQNQKMIFDFYYIFDSVEGGFLKSYSSRQSFYRLDQYLSAEDPSTLEPLYYASMDVNVEEGALTVFEGELPVDIHASFVQEIHLTAPKTTLTVGETIALKSEVLPTTAINKDLSFSSDIPGVASVDGDGRVTAISAGTVVITATNLDSGVSSSITFTVQDKPLIDPGDDSKKNDLKEALQKAKNQVFAFETGSFSYTTVPFDTNLDEFGHAKVNAEALSKLTVSEFAYDENNRVATFALKDKEKLVDILPYEDNKIEGLSNRYSINGDTVFRNVILTFEIHLKSSNEISFIIVETRNDTADIGSANFAELTTETIEEELAFSVNPYGTLKTKLNSKGFAKNDEETV